MSAFSARFVRNKSTIYVLTILFIILAASMLASAADDGKMLRNTYRDLSFALFPSAQLASTYGADYFNTSNRNYDVVRAERFYKEAIKLDASYPYVNHQLARLEFLQGHYETALLYINKQIELFGTTTPKAYYVKGLIEGYKGDYKNSEKDYQIYIAADPTNWAATNDLAWVLMKDKKYQEALDAIDKILPHWQTNPWLLNSKATALYELGNLKEARETVVAAVKAVSILTPAEWSKAYPGNDPMIAGAGLAAFQGAVSDNMHTITAAWQKGQTNVQ